MSTPPARVGRAEPDDVIDNLPPGSIRHELAAGNIKPVEGFPGWYKVVNGLDYPATKAPTPLPQASPGPQPDDTPTKKAPPADSELEATP